jgi:hypothetical protein
MADAVDSKSIGRKVVWVRLPPPALQFKRLRKQESPGMLLMGPPSLYSAALLLEVSCQTPGAFATHGRTPSALWTVCRARHPLAGTLWRRTMRSPPSRHHLNEHADP